MAYSTQGRGMTDAIVPVRRKAEKGRSLWANGWLRLKANRAAVASLFFLIAMTLACIIGPWLLPHPFDARYTDFTRKPPSLSTYPNAATLEPALKDALRQARVELVSFKREGDSLLIETKATRKIDERNVRYLDRSASFQNSTVASKSPDGLSMTFRTEIEKRRFWFGTDANGRDLLVRTLYAGRISLAIGVLAGLTAVIIGVAYGAVSGFLGGRIDNVMMRIVDIIYALPFIFFVIMLVVFYGRNFVLMFVAVGCVTWLDMARIVRGQTLAIKRQEYVQAAEALGVKPGGILWRHVIPNTLGPVIVYMTLLVPQVIILESFLSFLGLGVQEPMTSWGVLISEGANNLGAANWLLLFPALFLISTLFALNFLGDGLRDALDPKDR
jgi:oligopeptide transport system permease protein